MTIDPLPEETLSCGHVGEEIYFDEVLLLYSSGRACCLTFHRLNDDALEHFTWNLTFEPAVIKSYYDKRIVGCPGVEGEDEHDVVWFWLEKGKPHECPVCSQYFVLEVVGPGGSPGGHGDDEDDHHH